MYDVMEIVSSPDWLKIIFLLQLNKSFKNQLTKLITGLFLLSHEKLTSWRYIVFFGLFWTFKVICKKKNL